MKTFIQVFVFLFSVSVFAASGLTRNLPASDRLAKVARAMGTQLGDGNISTGTTSLSAAVLTAAIPEDAKALRDELVMPLFREAFLDRVGEELPGDAKLTLKAADFKDSQVNGVAYALAEGNAYNVGNGEILNGLRRMVWAVLRALPVDGETLFGSVETRLLSENTGAMRNIYFFVFLQPQTGKLVKIFVIEGDM